MNESIDFTVTASPHIKSGNSVKKEMWLVVAALVPALIAGYIFFGIPAVVITSECVAACVLFEAIIQWLRKKPITVSDGSAVITGILLAFNLPSTVPWWLAVVGSAFSILVVKQAFGGLGQNIFNPALAGRAFLLAAYPTYMTDWMPTRLMQGVDIVTYATPLAVLKEKTGAMLPTYWDMFIGNRGGCIGETCALALILGGIFLLYKKIISWHIPVAYIGTVFLMTWILKQDPIFHVMAGGLLLGAFFMATDYVTKPITGKGMIIFGIGCGVLTVFIRLYGNYPEGVSYAILLMNTCTPIIDRYIKPKRFGLR